MARVFNGSTDKILIAAQQWPQTAFSSCAWIYQTAAATTVPIAMNDGQNSASYCQFIVVSDGSVQGRMVRQINTDYIGRATAAGAIGNNAWKHMAMTWDGGTTAAAIKVYINGVQSDTTNANAGVFPGPYIGTNVRATIGCQLDASGNAQNTFTGRMAEYALWSVALTAGEVAGLAAGRRIYDVRQKSLVAYLPIDGLQSPEPDLSGNLKNGTLTGTAFAAGPPITTFTPRWRQLELPTSLSFIPAWAAQSNVPVIGAGTL